MQTLISQEKLRQAQSLLAPGDLWLIAARETLERPEPGLDLVAPVHLTWDTFFLITAQEAIAIAGRFDAASVPGDFRVISYDEDYAIDLRREVARLAPRQILLNFAPDNALLDGLSHGLYLKIVAALPGAPLVSAAHFLGQLRSVKTPLEQQHLRAAVDRAEDHLEEMARTVRAGWSELEVAAWLQQRCTAEGISPAWGWEGCPNVTMARMPAHAGPTSKVLQPGMLMHLDYGVRLEGYCSDVQRIYYLAQPGSGIPERLQAAFETVWRAIEAAAQALRPGALGHQVDAAARRVIVEAGYPEYMYGTGHNLGRATHDGGTLLAPLWPRYGQAPQGQVRVGEVYTLELGVMLEGIGYVGLEEDVLVKPEGVDWLSRRQNQLYLLSQQ